MLVSIIGAGYVGLVTGACLAEVGHDVTCVDVDTTRVDGLNRGQAPIHEPGLDLLLARHAAKNFRGTTDLASSVHGTDLTMIAVGTPFDGQQIDLSYVKEAARQIGEALADKSSYHLVVVKSTVVPGTTDDVVSPIIAAASGKTAGIDFGVATNPEFLSEGTAIEDFQRPDRIVLGVHSDRDAAMLEALYAAYAEAPRVRTTPKSAEMIKYTSNALLAALISFANEMGNVCHELGGIDAVDVMRGVHLSQYLTPFTRDGRAATAPIAAFLSAGCGFGGSCLPKDVAALIRHAEQTGERPRLLSAVLEINQDQPQRLLELLEPHFPSLENVRVTVLGLAFKPDTDDMRMSPAIPIVEKLLAAGAVVTAYDPIANDAARRAMRNPPLTFAVSLDEAIVEAEAILLVTRWNEFRRLPELLAQRPGLPPLVVDGRRLLPPDSVPRYAGIGLGQKALAYST